MHVCICHDVMDVNKYMLTKSRIYSIDTLRFAAVFGVICMHFQSFRQISYPVNAIIDQVANFAVPFFFLVSGYLFRKKIMAGDDAYWRYSRMMKRLCLIFWTWSAIYLFVPANPVMLTQAKQLGLISGLKMIFNSKIDAIKSNPLDFLLAGTSIQLWYLVSLAMGLTLLFIFMKLRIEDKLLYLAVPLYCFQILAGPLSNTRIGIHIGTAYWLGPFVSTLFVGIGALIAKKEYRPSPQLAYWLILAGLVMQLGEWLLLHTIYGWDRFRQTGYLIGTVLYATGFLLLALTIPSMGYRTGLTRLGKFTLGIYLTHMIFIPFAQKLNGTLPKHIGEVGPLGVLAASLLLTIILIQLPYLRRIVT
ncbi:MAG: acyltransferase [Bacteroidales bacterium]